ncbi:LysM domain-containing protein [Colletotrichum higginsianum IMI 349063]|uniref:LysM domain-containing protein n=1 Tax=Colletotrichum higginsianum (strain IMI 349063) TaxID=759273 RepID=A0A1B7YLN8_COLHI|nr:LysM domain-containing protein [Colletotrichum higginsianum IMI 349063]OBR12818.1 LysM domain-containing protein [Colletotrichum higginsianum IMI 349063]
MATSSQPAGPLDEGPPYRSFEELRGDPTVAVVFTAAAKRLFWPLDGVFPTALSVMKTLRSADDLEPYFQQTLGGGGIWHEIAQLPLTEPKVSSVEASVYDLEQWEFNWVAWHTHHEGEPANPEYVTYGDLSDEDRPYAKEPKEDGSWEEDSDTEFLVRCCGQDRPLRKRGQKLVVTPAAGGHFVTTHDYVSAVHPWLMGLRPEILLAKTVAQPEPQPGSAGMAWMVDQGPEHKVEAKQSWIQAHGGGPPRPIPASTAAILARIRASRNR